MRPHAVYIIAQDGRNAFSKIFSTKAPNEDLVSAMLVAMQNFVKEVTGTYFSELTAGPIQFSSEKAGPFYVVLVSTRSKLALEKVKHLGILFMRRYKTLIENWKGETIHFEDFEKDIEDVLGEFNEALRIDPKKPLDATSLIFLEKDIQPVARLILRKRELSPFDVSNALNMDINNAISKLERLFSMGHLGKYEENNETYYFVQ